jgi:hemerythrin
MSAKTTLVWNDSLMVGNAVIDADHRETVELLAEVIDAGDDALPELFTRFALHLRTHLSREEELMRRYGFPASTIHKMEHDRVRMELDGIETRLAAGNLQLVRTYTSTVVPEWFINHKDTMDAATAGWIRQCGN